MPTDIVLMFFVLIATMSLANTDDRQPQPQVPCYFIFGDSLMDNGNNNHLHNTVKANYPPYGIDFPDGPTGRFTNGRNTADVIAQLLGFKSFIPPFATAKGKEIINGVNYASGGAGIRDETGQYLGEIISFNKQISNHRVTVLQLSFMIGNGSLAMTRKYLNKCLYTIGMGNNDYISNYFVPVYYDTIGLYTPEEYAQVLVEQYSRQLQELYEIGARRFGIFAADRSSCTPGVMADFDMNSCVDLVNNATILFNTHLNTTLNDLNTKFPDAKFILIDGPVEYPNDTDLNNTDEPCCEVVSSTNAKGSCIPNQVPCINRKNYYFWDAYHPTERVTVTYGINAYETLFPLYTSEDFPPLKEKEVDLVSDV